MRNRLGLVVVLWALFMVIVGTTIPTPLYGHYKVEYGLADWSITAIYAIYALGIVVALIVLNDLSNWLGRRGALMVGLGLAVLADIMFLTIHSAAGLYSARVVTGLAAGIFVGTATVAAIETSSARLKPSASTFATAANVIGLGGGPLIGGIIAQYLTPPDRWVFGAHLGATMAALALMPLMIEPIISRRKGLAIVLPQLPRTQRRPYFGLAAIGIAGLSAFGLLAGLTQVFLTNIGRADAGSLVVGLIVGVAFITSGVCQIVFKNISVTTGVRWGCVLLGAGVVIIAASIPASSLTAYVIGAIISGVGQGLTMSRCVKTASEMVDQEDRMSVMNLFFALVYLGAGIPIVALGFAITYWEFDLSVHIFTAVTLVSLCGGLALLKGALRPTTPADVETGA